MNTGNGNSLSHYLIHLGWESSLPQRRMEWEVKEEDEEEVPNSLPKRIFQSRFLLTSSSLLSLLGQHLSFAALRAR